MFEMDTLYLNENCSLLKQIKKKDTIYIGSKKCVLPI